MRNFLPYVALAGLALVSPSFAKDAPAGEPIETETKGEAELAKILEGRVAGEPIRCLTQAQRRNLRIVDETAMVFRAGRTIYVNRTSAPAFLDDWDYPVFRLYSSSLCKLDQVEMRERSSNFPGPFVTMGEFIPYTRIETETEI